MLAKDLANELLKNPDFTISFCFTDGYSDGDIKWPNTRKFQNISIGDIGYSDKNIQLDGDEY
jgi:hypothetical protein